MAYHYNHILIRYGELSLKGKNRNVFIKQLKKNMKAALKTFPSLEYDAQHDRMYIYLNGEDADQVCAIVSKVFGISSLSLAIKVPSDIEEIKKACMESLDFTEFKTFKVAARRSDKMFPLISDQINRLVATEILKNTEWKVNVKNPDVKIIIEVHRDGTYIMTDRIEGAGGFPVGCGGKAMALLSGGIDSPVATYLMMKRGVHVECIHYASPPYTSQAAQDKVLELARLISGYQGEILVHVVPFTNLQLEIYKHADESYAITLMRRMMMRIATGLAEKRHAQAIATGESVGQVASQTLESMQAINNVTTTPILRPVVTMDKVEIIDIARKIGTFETSILPFEDCCTIFTPKNPVTKPRIDKCERYESRWDWQSMVQECIDNAQPVWISPVKVEEDLVGELELF
ncbi:MAG: tRNA 4-thiouridine(8) synthase ThiI [Firmicutes bacterium]|nr:tRNA 4-thiouridine(8) synthase ThiI [Bacillota bacterium]